jgi:UDP-GlcNAc:undecaprenyl-phosphate GlcNAc-1-phosphate transferase
MLVGTLIPVYLGGIGLLAGPASKDMGVISAVLFAVMVAELLFGRGAASIAVRGGIYIAAVFAVYLTIHTPLDAFPPFWGALETVYFIVLAIAIALNVRYATDKRFEATPLDYLLMFGVLTIGFFGQRYLQVQEIGGLVVRTMILLYGCEVLIERSPRRWNLLSVSSTLALGVFGVKGLFAF